MNTQKTIGFPISHKENENRRAIIPKHVRCLSHPENTYFETGYGEVMKIPDSRFASLGCNVVKHEEVLRQDIICDIKVGNADYLDSLKPGQTIMGWVHAEQNQEMANTLITHKLTAYAWENMFEKGRHIFWRNNELAGEAAVMHAYRCYGSMPYETNVAVIGRGNTARGAIKVLNMLGATVKQYNRRMEELLREEIGQYDVIVNCILWDVSRTDHIIYRSDLARMKPGAMIIDVSCDRHGGIETSVPTTIEKPTYFVDGILHYAVDHTPALFYKTFTMNNSQIIYPYLEELMCSHCGKVLKDALIVKDGIVVNPKLREHLQ